MSTFHICITFQVEIFQTKDMYLFLQEMHSSMKLISCSRPDSNLSSGTYVEYMLYTGLDLF